MHRVPALFVVPVVLLAASSARGQSVPRCAPRIEVQGGVPPRLAQRLRALEMLLGGRVERGCETPRVRFGWNARRLTVEIALEDGRIASRTLGSLDDALPTVLAVLAAPDPHGADEGAPDEAPPSAEEPERPVETTAPVAVTSPAAPPMTVRRGMRDDWRLTVRLGAGSLVMDGARSLLGRAEVGLVRDHFRLSARASLSLDRGEGAPWQDDARVGLHLAASAAYRWRAGRWTFELGGSLGRQRSIEDGASEADARDANAWRFGGELTVLRRFVDDLSMMVQVEGGFAPPLGGRRGWGFAVEPSWSASVVAGVAWEGAL